MSHSDDIFDGFIIDSCDSVVKRKRLRLSRPVQSHRRREIIMSRLNVIGHREALRRVIRIWRICYEVRSCYSSEAVL